MKTFLKNKKFIKIFLLCSLICIFFLTTLKVISVFIFFDFSIKDKKQEIGVSCKLTGNINNTKYKVKFPYFQYDEIDNVIYKEIRNEINNFSKKHKDSEKNKAKFYGDYESFTFNNNYGVSVGFRFLEKDRDAEKERVKTLCFCYGKKMDANNIFIEDKVKDVVSLIKSSIRANTDIFNKIKKQSVNLDEKLKDNMSSLKNFIIKKDTIEFLFDEGAILPEKFGIISVEILNSSLKTALSRTYFKINPKEGELKGEDLEKTKKPLVALTFDDGPNEETTGTILDVLEKNNAHATFFVIGQYAKKHPEILKREIAGGHEICNHTYTHPTLTHLKGKDIKDQIEKTDRAVEEAVGTVPKWVRAPGGSVNSLVKKTCGELQKFLAYWSVDTRDWQTRNTQKTIDCVLKNVEDGSVVLMHDIYPETVKAAKTIIPELISRGFLLVTISDLFRLKNVPIEVGTQYSAAKI